MISVHGGKSYKYFLVSFTRNINQIAIKIIVSRFELKVLIMTHSFVCTVDRWGELKISAVWNGCNFVPIHALVSDLFWDRPRKIFCLSILLVRYFTNLEVVLCRRHMSKIGTTDKPTRTSQYSRGFQAQFT